MKNNALLIWNIILTLLVAFLLVKQFGTPKTTEPEVVEGTTEETPSIVFINADTLLMNFDEFSEQEEALAAKEIDIDSKLKSRARALEQEFAAAQQKIQQGLLTPNQIQQEEQRLMGKQQRLVQDQERMTQELMAETQVLNNQLEERLRGVLKDVREANGYDFILSYGPGTGVLMVNDSLDVTMKVLERLEETKAAEGQ